HGLSALWPAPARERPGPLAPPGGGAARRPARRRGVSAAPPRLPVLSHLDLRRAARRRPRPLRPAVGGHPGPAGRSPPARPAATLFRIAYRRTAQVAQELLGTRYAGVATCDRLKSYWWIRRLQWCWAHLRRDFQAMIDRGNEGQGIGRALLRQSDRLFHLWHQLNHGRLSRARFREAIQSVRQAVRRALRRGR